MTWDLINAFDEYYDFERELISADDVGRTGLVLRVTFNIETHTAYMTVSWRNDDGYTVDLNYDRYIEWGAAMRLLGDTPIPEELK